MLAVLTVGVSPASASVATYGWRPVVPVRPPITAVPHRAETHAPVVRRSWVPSLASPLIHRP